MPARVCVVTGAGSGIGRACVDLIAQAPDAVIVGVDLVDPPPELHALENVEWIRGSVTDALTWDEVRARSAAIDERGPASMIACAGALRLGPFVDVSVDEWRDLFEVNVLGTVRGMQALIPAMSRRGGGAIAVVCSVNSMFVSQGGSAYSTSKAALLQAVRSAALEHAADGIRINAVCPGDVDTPMLQRAFDATGHPDAVRREAELRTPTGRVHDPKEIASILAFLVSSQASALSGAAVVADGGLTTAYSFSLESAQ